MGTEIEGDGVPSYLQPDKESDLDAELNLPSAPSGHAAPAGRANTQVIFHVAIRNLFSCIPAECMETKSYYAREKPIVLTGSDEIDASQ